MKGQAKICLTLKKSCNAAGLVWPAAKVADGGGGGISAIVVTPTRLLEITGTLELVSIWVVCVLWDQSLDFTEHIYTGAAM
jgi:hypothetical protein